MADQILKSTSDKIWVNSAGKVMKAKKFNESVLQVGLSFWGAADPAYLTIIDGLVSEAYDIRGTGQKMVQNTVTRRPKLILNELLFSRSNDSLYMNSQSARSVFIIMKIPVGGQTVHGIRGSSMDLGTTTSQYGYGQYPTYTYNYYFNNIEKTVLTSNPFTYVILHSKYDFNTINSLITIGDFYGYQLNCYIKEWGWYNRILTDIEINYNINALNAKYQIF